VQYAGYGIEVNHLFFSIAIVYSGFLILSLEFGYRFKGLERGSSCSVRVDANSFASNFFNNSVWYWKPIT